MSLENDLLNCIRQRRSTRKYTDRQIAPGQLDTLLESATWAPNGGNNQSWLFTAIQNQDALIRLNNLTREAFQNWVPDDDYPAKLEIRERSRKEDYCFYYHAPTLIIASNRPNYANAMADCALAMQNVFLMAQAMGLGSCYLNQLHWLRNDMNVRAYLAEWGLPREQVICSAAAIGYIATPSSAPPRKGGTTMIIH